MAGWWDSLFGEEGGFFDFDLPNAEELPVIGSLVGGSPEEQKKKAQEGQYNTFAKQAGLATTSQLQNSTASIEAMLEQAGVDVSHPNVQLAIQNFGDMLRDPNLASAMVASLAETYPAHIRTAYDDALELSGFAGTNYPAPQLGAAPKIAGMEGLQIADFKVEGPKYQANDETGWIRFPNGVLVSPDGQVVFDPTSKAPGSVAWQREVVSSWGPEKVSEWRGRLHEFGYLSKDQAKVNGVDDVFLNALSAYHLARYRNGGKPVAGDLAGAGGTAPSKPPLVDFEDMKGQIRNDVREQYRRVFGEDPTDGEVAAWSDYIIRSGMELQRKYRGKEYGNYTGMAATEAEERFVERLEGSPQATFLRDSEEENTRLRDALQQAVVVANSLG